MNIVPAIIRLAVFVLLCINIFPLNAAPLPKGTMLTINSGLSSEVPGCSGGSCFQCYAGSCLTIRASNGLYHYPYTLTPGSDGGFVIGKNQVSGGQENYATRSNTSPGELAGMVILPPYTFVPASLYTAPAPYDPADATANIFDDTSCASASACTGKTVLRALNVAGGGGTISLGDAYCYPFCGPVTNWKITPAGAPGVNGDRYELDYQTALYNSLDGYHTIYTFHFEGNIVLASGTGNPPPIVSNVNTTAVSGSSVAWTPVASDPNGSPITCRIGTPSLNGTATVAANCASGTYQSKPGFVGIDSFTYIASNSSSDSNPATITVAVTEPFSTDSCLAQYPVSSFSQTGKVGTITITFTGNIVSYTNKAVKVCPGTSLSYQVTSTLGPVICKRRHNTTSGTGTLRINDDLKCTDKPTGKDKIQVKVKSGVAG